MPQQERTETGRGACTGNGTSTGAVSPRRRQTRERLLEAAREVFAAKGVHGASVEEICELAGFTRGAFYSNYTDKDELTLDLLEREQRLAFDRVDLSVATADVDTTVEAILDLQVPQREYFLIHTELALLAMREPGFTGVVGTSEQAVTDSLVELLSAAMDRLDLESVMPVPDLADVILAIHERSMRQGILAGEDDLLRLARTTLPSILSCMTRPRRRETSG